MKVILIFLGALVGAFYGSMVIVSREHVSNLIGLFGTSLTALGIYLGLKSKSVKLDGWPQKVLPTQNLQKQGAKQAIEAKVVNKSEFIVRIQGVYIVLQTRFLKKTIAEYSVNSEKTQQVDIQPNDYLVSEHCLLIPRESQEIMKFKNKKVKVAVVVYHSGMEKTILKKKIRIELDSILFGDN